jgi:hypothetical protein
MDVHIRQTGHEKFIAPVQSQCSFRDTSLPHWAGCCYAAMIDNHSLVQKEALAVHRHNSDIEERYRSLLAGYAKGSKEQADQNSS